MFRGLSVTFFDCPVRGACCAAFMETEVQFAARAIGLPVVGYLPFLREEPFKVLSRLREKYGNIFSLRLGQADVVVLGDYPAVKEAFGKPSTTDRPPRLFDIIPDGGGFGGASGEEWVEQRRFVVRSMKDIGLGGSSWGRLVEDEVSDFIEILSSHKGQPIDIVKLLTTTITNNITSLVFGRRLPAGPERDFMYSALDTVTRHFSSSSFQNFLPFLYDILVKLKISNYHKIQSIIEGFNLVVRKETEIRKNAQEDPNEESNFINEYVQAIHANKGKQSYFTESNLVANARGLFIAGSDTSRTSLMWLLLAMCIYPEVQEKVHQELESVLGKSRRATWEDRLKFPYIYSVIMEGQRWKTVVPINLLRMASEDINVGGYDIPKGTVILANIWNIHNDTRYWKEPEKFIPERFLQSGGSEVDLKKESYIPFSYGKRKCPGETVAMMTIFLYFTTIIQMFEVRVPKGAKANMDGDFGITYQPFPQKLCFIPREGTAQHA